MTIQETIQTLEKMLYDVVVMIWMCLREHCRCLLI